MKASQMIAQLANLIEQQGDLVVVKETVVKGYDANEEVVEESKDTPIRSVYFYHYETDGVKLPCFYIFGEQE